jgi:hypothetical protein
MKTLESNSDPWPLSFRSSECHSNFVRTPQNKPFELTYQTLNWLVLSVRIVPLSFHQVLKPESGAARIDQSP